MSKGSGRRPQQVSEDELERNWQRTFGQDGVTLTQLVEESKPWTRLRGFQPPVEERLER